MDESATKESLSRGGIELDRRSPNIICVHLCSSVVKKQAKADSSSSMV